ncbi:PRC-barrel domain-containing protein [Ideonella sp. BN130291]|uniref:PRC-barrel domain-containing protein n=1 Tax=Ideonella sp. BN130291 TaxID=3112940 RepID=UPI002E27556B|nr:PRC-barrel domain-containing protein [Ideonella sp. BN130291]
MKLQLVALPLSALLLAGHGAQAQGGVSTPATAAPASSGTTTTSGERAAQDRNAERGWERTHRVSRIIGTDVRNRQGQKIGDIKDVVLDDRGQIAYAVVSTGGFLGMGDRLHAIPWAALQKDGDKAHLVLDIDKERLKKAPGFDSRHWPNMAEERWNSETRGFYANPQR